MGVIYEAIYKLTYVVSYIPVALFLGGGVELTIYNTTHASQKLETGLSLLLARG